MRSALTVLLAFAAGVLDVPWSPNRHVKSRVMPARDVDGYLRILEPAMVPLPNDVREFHEAKLRARAERDGVAYGRDLAVQSVYELSEPLAHLLPDRPSA